MKLDPLLLQTGVDIPFNQARLTIHQPKLREISYVGEIKREGNKKKGVRYRVTLDRDRGIALFDKVT